MRLSDMLPILHVVKLVDHISVFFSQIPQGHAAPKGQTSIPVSGFGGKALALTTTPRKDRTASLWENYYEA